ncbi:MAG TPA: beta-propeller fold lactonase family protein [Candidatus Limnocylindrales bacterium]|nr:beta-propeller fold lactonase family protein [Candidatus Limnocylindrales bacterium]
MPTVPLSDIVLDEARKQIYVLESNLSTPVVYIYTTTTSPPSVTATNGVVSIAVGRQPTSMAMSPDGAFLYVTCFTDNALDIIDLARRTKVKSVSLGSVNPQAVAVGGDGKVLISVTASPSLLTYDPTTGTVGSVTISPAAPTIPSTTTPGVALFLEPHARLVVNSADRTKIVGVHEQGATRVVFVYDVASQTVLRTRTFNGLSPILAVDARGTRILTGQTLVEAATMAVLAQQTATNAPFLVTPNANFNTQTNQGGAVFAPDGSTLYTAYNIIPVLNPSAQTNTTQLWFNSPDNLLVNLGLMLPQTLSGKMVISGDGQTIYAISQSGFLSLPVGTVRTKLPIAIPDTTAAVLVNDQCGVNAAQNSAVIPVRNAGAGAMTVSAAVNVTTTTSTTASVSAKSYGGDVTARFNAAAARTLGTSTPDQLLLQSPQAVNMIPSVRVFQNYRNSEQAGTLVPVDTGGVTPSVAGGSVAGLTDIVADTPRQRLYIANAGMNRIEVFDTQQKKFVTPISVGQLPRNLAFSPDGASLYVANAGGEYISVVDLQKNTVSQVELPPQPFNSAFAVITPQFIAASQRGPLVIMSNGTLWHIVNGVLTPRTLNPLVFGAATTIAAQSMTSTPEGSYIVVLATSGIAYLYSAANDDFVQAQTVASQPITGYFGPIAAGPNGAYYAIGSQLYDQSLTLISNNGGSGAVNVGGLPIPVPNLTTRPVAAVAAVSGTIYAQFSEPVRTTPTATVTDAGTVQLFDVATQRSLATINTLEGPLQIATGAARISMNGRTMAIDAAGGTVYLLTASGLTVLSPSTATAPAPSFTAGSVTNTANFQPKIAPGGLISIFGKNLASAANSQGTPLPTTLGGACVTFNNAPIPLLATSPGQINAQVPTTLAVGNYPVVIRSFATNTASSSVIVTLAKYAPAVFIDTNGPAIFHANGERVDSSHPAVRDEHLTIYATGLGITTGGRVTTGAASPTSPLAVTSPLQLFFGDPTISDSGVIVDWSGLVPGSIGVYQINCRVPGTHLKGNGLAVTLRIGGISSPVTGANVPLVWVN